MSKIFIGIQSCKEKESRKEACRKTWLKDLDYDKYEYMFYQGGYEGPEPFLIEGDTISFRTPKPRKVEMWASYTDLENIEGEPIRTSEDSFPVGIKTWDNKIYLGQDIFRKVVSEHKLAIQWLHLTSQLKAICLWCLENKDPSFFVKLDDDDYVVGENFNKIDPTPYDYYGYFNSTDWLWAFGSGYFINNKCLRIFCNNSSQQQLADINIRCCHMDDCAMGYTLNAHCKDIVRQHEPQMKPWRPEYHEPLLSLEESKQLILSHGYENLGHMLDMRHRMNQILSK